MNDQVNKAGLAIRAKACSGWRWMPGMLVCGGWIVGGVEGGMANLVRLNESDSASTLTTLQTITAPVESMPPDITDPATLGCLLHLVREAWGNPRLGTGSNENGAWWVFDDSGCEVPERIIGSATEAEALVRALEGAPGDEDER